MQRIKNRVKLNNFIKKRPYLIWYVKDYDALDEVSIVEHTLNYGNWDDVQKMIKLLGIKKTAEIFREHAFRKRTNYGKRARNYFNLYFNKYA